MDPGTLEFLPITAPFWSPVAWIAANAIHRKNAKKETNNKITNDATPWCALGYRVHSAESNKMQAFAVEYRQYAQDVR